MRNALLCLVSVVVLSSAGLMATTMQQPPADKRAQARKLLEENNFNDALQLYRELAVDSENTGKAVPEDLGVAIAGLNNLGLVHEADELIEVSIEAHKTDFRLLARAAAAYAGEIESGGFVIAGKFERGGHRGGGQWASVAARDRVRSLQLVLQAIALAEKDDNATAVERADLWQTISNQISSPRHGEAWKLQDLTDLATLPDFEISDGGMPYYGRGGRGMGRGIWPPGNTSKGAPVDKDGNPVFHHMPESWETAKSDGERWRWAMAQVVKHLEDRRSQIDLDWAGFLQSQFGVGASAVGGPPVIQITAKEEDADTAKPQDATTWKAHELPDSETIAKLTTGVKRFALPEEFNHVTIFKAVIARDGSEKRQALESLIGERMNRHQYAQAAELLREVLKLA
ncbi:MAG: alpha-2-macroglobulin, partial [Planctomycetota bacterium]